MEVPPRYKIGVAVGAALGVAAVLSFGPIVRHEARLSAERYGATIEIGRVVPAWAGVRLEGVDVVLADIPSARIRLDDVRVRFGGEAKRISLHGGTIEAVGPRQELVRQAEAWRARRHAGGGGGGRASELDFEGLDLLWRDAPDAAAHEQIVAKNVRIAREGTNLRFAADEASIVLGPATMTIRGGDIALVRGNEGYRIRDLSGSSVDLQVRLPDNPQSREGADAPPAARVVSADVAAAGSTGRGAAARDALVAGARAIDALLVENGKVALDGVRARVRRGDDNLSLGPGALGIRREQGRMLVTLAPSTNAPMPDQGGNAGPVEALTFRLSIPLHPSEEASGEVVADLDGGPISLSALGVQDGDFGLVDVRKTALETRSHVVLSADGQNLTLDGAGKVQNLSLRSPALSEEPVLGLELAWKGKGMLALDGSKIRVDEGEVDLGAIRVIAHGLYERVGDSKRVRGDFELPLNACQSMLNSVPKGLVPKLHGMRFVGSFALKGKADFDTAKLARSFDLDWDVSNSCRIVEVPAAVHVSRFIEPFQRWVYDAEGNQVEITSGPNTPGWVPYTSISRFMEIAVLTTEDGGFLRHHGFDEEAIRNSIRENLKEGKFVRGASTISMQLAKNLYLERRKNLSRKLQEAVLTMYLEQELTKEQIMELYLNVVEFGPMIYGIGPAAQHYFNTAPSGLSLGQALYLATLLPDPKKQHFGAGGAVTPMWTEYLRKLMQIAHKRHRITDEELEEGLRETVLRGSPAPHRSPPGESPDGHRFGGDDAPPLDDSGGWIAP